MNPAELGVAFGFGVVGSLHCAQMCGPIVLSYSLGLERGTAGRAHLLYNSGRVVTYALLGGVAGAAGHATGMVGRLAGFEQVAALAAGLLMLVTGAVSFGLVPANTLIRPGSGGLPGRLSRAAARLLLSPQPGSKFALGLVLGLLPCGLLYAALLQAMASGSAPRGALLMAAFGLGTAGALAGVGVLSSGIRRGLGRWSHPLAGAGILLTGLWLIWRGLMAQVPQPHCHGL